MAHGKDDLVSVLATSARTVKEMLELGDSRLLACDGPAGGQLPQLSPEEWGEVYRACKSIAAVDFSALPLHGREPFTYCKIRDDGEKEFCSEAEFAKPEDGWFPLHKTISTEEKEEEKEEEKTVRIPVDDLSCECCGEKTELCTCLVMTGSRDRIVCHYCVAAWFDGSVGTSDIKRSSLANRATSKREGTQI